MSSSPSDHLRFGPFEVDLRTKELWKHGTKLKLGGQPFEILTVLATRSGELVTRDELRSRIWPADTFVDFNHGLNAAVNKLREVLSDSADNPRYIETLPRRGYRFIALVESVQRSRPVPGLDGVSTPSGSLPVAAAAPSRETCLPRTTFPILRGSDQSIGALSGDAWLRKVLVASAVLIIVFLLIATFHWVVRKRIEADSGERSKRVVPLTTLAEPAIEPAFSPDGNQVAFKRDSLQPGVAGIYLKLIGSEHLLQLTKNPADCCPVWSPDGRYVAFSRYEKEPGIYTVPALGGAERRLYTAIPNKHAELDWSPDGKHIAFTSDEAQGATSIALLSLDDLKVHKLTRPPAQDEDWGPAFSPDGRQIAFVRAASTGFPQNLVLMPADGGEVRRLTREATELGPPAWAADGQSIVFSSHLNGQPTLFRIPARGGEATQIPNVGALTWHPAVARRGERLAFQQILTASSILQFDLHHPDNRVPITASKGRNDGPHFSPDGKRVAFMSDRSGSVEIWVSDRDGSNAVQYSDLPGGCGTPRWAPDGKTLAFDCQSGDHTGIFLANIDGGVQRPLLVDGYENAVPSWSQDGKWIYFASDRSGEFQVWKVLAAGGTIEQITWQGGFAPMESPDGKFIYYAKSRFPHPEIWRSHAHGHEEAPLSPPLRPTTWANWVLSDKGIYYITFEKDKGPAVHFLDLQTKQDRHLAALEIPPFWLTVTSDGTWAAYPQESLAESNIMLLENFH